MLRLLPKTASVSMRTDKKTQSDFTAGAGSEIPVPAPRTKGQSSTNSPEESPKPKVPPRMKKKGPALPEKPPHLRYSQNSLTSAPTATVVSPSQNITSSKASDSANHPGRANVLAHQNAIPPKSGLAIKQTHSDHQHGGNSQREILVAATKTDRNRPIERRQREPAKLLTAPPPVPKKAADSDEDYDSDPIIIKPRAHKAETKQTPNQKKSDKSKGAAIFNFRKNRAPMVLIPRGHPLLDARNLTPMWGGVYPTAYAMWLQNYDSVEPPSISSSSGLLRPIFGSSVDLRPYGVAAGHSSRGQQRSRPEAAGLRTRVRSPKSSKHSSASVASSAKPRSSSVTRSGSLTSHGSTSSDSGNETFPKSVLKKQKRNSSKGSDRPEQKKNVTFNAFATVQLMEE